VVLVIGLVAALAGWVLVRATIGRAPAGSAEAPSHEGVAVEASDDANGEPARGSAEADVEADVNVEANVEGNVEANGPEPDVAADVEPPAASPTVETPIPSPPSSTPSNTASTTVRRGRVAYIRCGDTERCPRDAALEEAAWAIVDALPSCARLAGQTGSADVRFHFEAETVEVRFRDHGDRPLAIPALRACLVGPSASLRTTLAPRPLTASFRFDLVAE
jgi:hypothetical protein